MNTRSQLLIFVCFGMALSIVGSNVFAANPYNLASGAKGKLCLECHEDFKATMKKKHIHTPLAKGECTGCHNPHAADHGKLLTEDASQVCNGCHDDLFPVDAVSAHNIVGQTGCVTCHDPHSSDYRNNLVKSGSELCFDCHGDLGQKISEAKMSHAPVADDCMTCHTPHASAKNPSLLKEQAPALCLKCHNPKKKTFKIQHVDYPVEQANCSSCHDPHGSNMESILYDNVHEPLNKRMCKQCHEEASSKTPLATLKDGYELCQGCHYDMVNDTFNKNQIHWPLVDNTGCLNCHSPHASATPGLMKAPMKKVCGSCHIDTIARQERALTKHQPIDDGECSTCHSPHSSDNTFLLTEKSTVRLCAGCHDWQTHSTHPIGEDVIDPRNPNLQLDCLSCHRTHGTEFVHFIYNESINELCVQCHSNYRR